ncbi:MAG: hypothetical protein LBP62_07515, partial [Clostridiales bacterium]|nr:hypothetical protein [Clostridiales bacterium]
PTPPPAPLPTLKDLTIYGANLFEKRFPPCPLSKTFIYLLITANRPLLSVAPPLNPLPRRGIFAVFAF